MARVRPCPYWAGREEPAQYYHDFGSILAFIENNFLGPSGIGTINSANGYPFADAYYPELAPEYGGPYLPLGDFFGLWQGGAGTPRSFDKIQCPVSAKAHYTGDPTTFCPDYFKNYNGPITDPDNDVIDSITD